jgi:hypothetical protein
MRILSRTQIDEAIRRFARQIGRSCTWIQKLPRQLSTSRSTRLQLPRLSFWAAFVELSEKKARNPEMREWSCFGWRYNRFQRFQNEAGCEEELLCSPSVKLTHSNGGCHELNPATGPPAETG